MWKFLLHNHYLAPKSVDKALTLSDIEVSVEGNQTNSHMMMTIKALRDANGTFDEVLGPPVTIHDVSPPIVNANKTIVYPPAMRHNASTPIMPSTTKVDASKGTNNRTHPHMGARDANGKYGYVPDTTLLHRAPFPSITVNCSALQIRDPTYMMLTKKVKVNMEEHEKREQEVAQGKQKQRVKLLCLIYSIEPRHERIPWIRETWGYKCDGFMVASNKTDVSIDAVDIPHEGPEGYQSMWQKVRSIWSYVYDNFYDDFDWFHIGGDDMYVIVENLRLYLESDQIQTAARSAPLYLGRRFALHGNKAKMYVAGGPGYTLNKAALKALVVDGFPYFFIHSFWSAEDVLVGGTFGKLGIHPFDTTDETGADRYHPFDPGYHCTYQPGNDWFAKYSVNSKYGLDGTAVHAVSFHYFLDAEYFRRVHALLYPDTHACFRNTTNSTSSSKS